jgi:hypothetical protein
MGQRITISETEKNRIKGLYEQGKPLPGPPKTAKGDMTSLLKMEGQTVNLYRDAENKQYHFTGTIKTIYKGDDIRIKFSEFPDLIFVYKCNKNYLYRFDSQDKRFYSALFTTKLNKELCGVSSGGQSVPKANYTQTSSASSDMV